MLNKQVFIEYMAGLCEIFNKEPSEFIYSTYYEILKGYSTEKVKKAITACVKSHKYNTLPTPAEILEFLEETYGQMMLRLGDEATKKMIQYEKESKQTQIPPLRKK